MTGYLEEDGGGEREIRAVIVRLCLLWSVLYSTHLCVLKCLHWQTFDLLQQDSLQEVLEDETVGQTCAEGADLSSPSSP